MILLLAVAGGGCRCGAEKQEIGLARLGDAAPVVVVDRAFEGGGAGGGYSGPMTPEAEPNDQRDQAGALGVPGGIEGALAAPTDIDFYKIEGGVARMVAVRLVGPAAEAGGADLVLTLYDADGKPVAQSDRGPAATLEALPNAGLAAGKAHFLSVSQFVKKESRKKKKKKPAPATGDAGTAAGGPTYKLTIEAARPGRARRRSRTTSRPAPARCCSTRRCPGTSAGTRIATAGS